MKTKLSIIFKHGNRKNGKYYIRIREGKKEKLLPVGRSLPDAERQLRAAVRVQEEIADLEAEGKPVPDELRRSYYTKNAATSRPSRSCWGTAPRWLCSITRTRGRWMTCAGCCSMSDFRSSGPQSLNSFFS